MRKNEGARKGNPEDFYRVLGPQARLKSEGKPICKQLDFRHQMVPIAQPSCPTASLIIRLFDTPHRLTNSQPKAPGRRFAPAQVLFVEGAIRTGETRCTFPRGTRGASALRRPNPLRRLRRLRSPLSANTPWSFRSAGFPSSPARPLASNFRGITVTSSLFQIKLEARAAGMVGALLGRGRAHESLLPCCHLRVHHACLGAFRASSSRPRAGPPAEATTPGAPKPQPREPTARRRMVPCLLFWHPSASERKEGGTPVLGGAFLRACLAFRRACSHFPKPSLAAGSCLGPVPTQTQPEGRV